MDRSVGPCLFCLTRPCVGVARALIAHILRLLILADVLQAPAPEASISLAEHEINAVCDGKVVRP